MIDKSPLCVLPKDCLTCPYIYGCDMNDFEQCKTCHSNLRSENSSENVWHFIKTFAAAHDTFLYGNCYWFAFILQNRFNGTILYDEIDNHYLCEINGRIYDVRGEVTDFYSNVNLINWNDMLFKDPVLYKRLVRDCILKIGE
mgnify:CR=1 FL=1